MLLFLVDLINIEIFRISFSFFYSFSFILRSRATSITYANYNIFGILMGHFSIQMTSNSKNNYQNTLPVLYLLSISAIFICQYLDFMLNFEKDLSTYDTRNILKPYFLPFFKPYFVNSAAHST